MLIEATERPFIYQWPGGEIRLEPGRPVSLPDDRARKLLARVGSRAKEVQPDWESAWEELARVTNGITREDPRFQPIMDALDVCDQEFLFGDWEAFQRAAVAVKALVAKGAEEQM